MILIALAFAAGFIMGAVVGAGYFATRPDIADVVAKETAKRVEAELRSLASNVAKELAAEVSSVTRW